MGIGTGPRPRKKPTKAKISKKGEGGGAAIPMSERRAVVFFTQLSAHIKKHEGKFLRDEWGQLHLLIKQQRIPLNRDQGNHALAALMLKVSGVSTLPAGAQAAIQRLQVLAETQAGVMRFREFSAMSDDLESLYLPIADQRLLKITASVIEPVENGNDSLWLEQPKGNVGEITINQDAPLSYRAGNPQVGLAAFERLLVETQACRLPGMRWFVAMHEGLFPYVRGTCPARLIVEHNGKFQQGKTSGAQRFTLLHGLGEVLGDATPASLANMGDIGLLTADNKEQKNFSQQTIDFYLFLSTGAMRVRSKRDGTIRPAAKGRPVGVITSIEGVHKAELQARCVEVLYEIKGKERLPRSEIEREIAKRRHEITSALVPVLQRYMQLCRERRSAPNPIPEFAEHFNALCTLLRAYGDVAKMPEGWAEHIIEGWDAALSSREPEENELEPVLLEIFRECEKGNNLRCDIERLADVTYEGQKGTLFVTDCGSLLYELKQRLRGEELPRNSRGFGRRLRASDFSAFEIVDEKHADRFIALKRTARRRPIGFFVGDDK